MISTKGAELIQKDYRRKGFNVSALHIAVQISSLIITASH
ncbi:hypothetical protein SP36_65 [Salmonella phage 36]|uniref:Uncharacterized protein n=1 Tax=Salmonella phage 36 TaxID=1654889 RepID=A0A0N7CE25_9CAUD|nr:hypothetical protein SP36_65 [Salmonella phage 36]AKJ74037.1 hypothetical protein SP36_65 [Salmonella phage 36]